MGSSLSPRVCFRGSTLSRASDLPMVLLALLTGCGSPEISNEESLFQECKEDAQAVEIELRDAPVQVDIAQGMWRVDIGVSIRGCSTSKELVIEGFSDRIRSVLSQQEDLIFPLVFEANRNDPVVLGKILEVVKVALPELTTVSMELTVETIQDHNMTEIPPPKEDAG